MQLLCRVSRSNIKGIGGTFLVIYLVWLVLIVTSPHDWLSNLEFAAGWFLFLSIIPAWILLMDIRLDQATLFLPLGFWFHKPVPVKNIRALKYKIKGAYSIAMMEVDYLDSAGRAQRKAVSLGLYEKAKLKDLVGELIQTNPSITVDPHVTTALEAKEAAPKKFTFHNYKQQIIGVSSALVSAVLFFTGLSYQDYINQHFPSLLFGFPICILLMIFFTGYAIGNLKLGGILARKIHGGRRM